MLVMTCGVLLAAKAETQVVAVGAPGGTVTADEFGNLSINVGEVSSDLLIRIYDPATCAEDTGPTLNVGTVTITGSATSTGRLRILVANCDLHDDFDPLSDNPLARLFEGVVNFGHAANGA